MPPARFADVWGAPRPCGGGAGAHAGWELTRVGDREWRTENDQVIAAKTSERVFGSSTPGRRSAIEETLQTRGCNDDQEADGFVAACLPRVRDPARDEDEAATRRFLDLIGEPDAKCAVEDVDHLVEPVVHVIRRPLPRRVHRFEHRQRAARLRPASLEHDLRTDPEALQALIDTKIGQLGVPLLGVFGRAITDSERERFGWLADVQLEEWLGDGHFVHLVEPDRFAIRLRQFVDHCTAAG